MIKATVARMSDLIADIQDFARGRLVGGITLHCDGRPLEPVLEQVVDELRTASPERLRPTGLRWGGRRRRIQPMGRERGRPNSRSRDGKIVRTVFSGRCPHSCQGLDLGLHIASQISQAHGGRIEVGIDAGADQVRPQDACRGRCPVMVDRRPRCALSGLRPGKRNLGKCPC